MKDLIKKIELSDYAVQLSITVDSVSLLVIPKKHIDSLADVADEETPLIGRMVKIANRIAREEKVAESGYRLIISSGKDGGQVVPHLHMHLLGGRNLSSKLC